MHAGDNAQLSEARNVLRAQVQSQNRIQQVTAAQNDVEKKKLDLARAIGLPAGQAFAVTDKMPVSLPQPVSLETALQHAYDNRNDLKRAESAVRAAELQKKAAVAKWLPSARFDGDYGDILKLLILTGLFGPLD